jgi:molecular chaperone DnaK (HSP70)
MASRSNSAARYLIGIDLGTTHTVVAYSDAEQPPDGGILLFEIEQLIAPGELAERPLLPSVRYHPAEGELDDGDIRLPWTPLSIDGEIAPVIIGELARTLGAKTQGRMVTSAKSWLSHPSADRTAAILPWGSAKDVPKVSPVIASAGYLGYVRSAWNARFPNHPLEQQELVLTVPASFDEAARSLTLEAARLAGLGGVRLLEEPQAVCYDWLWRHQKDLERSLHDIRLLLVCDIGGGTTDLTLIKIEPGDDVPKLTRVAVGDHLMLGGDNIDLTLAHLIEKRLVGNDERLSAADLSLLIEQCRLAKERLLDADAPDSYTVTLLGSGARLIGGARSARLSHKEVESIVLDGFFPMTGLTDYPDRKRSGVVEFGLPYVAEPAVSKHIAAFLGRHTSDANDALNEANAPPVPDAALLNGGLFHSEAISRRLLAILSAWRQQPLRHLDNEHPNLAVAFGAVAYAMARRGEQVRIGGGAARSYFLAVGKESNETPAGICILPKGSEEGHEIRLPHRTFSLRLGEPVRFHLVSSTEESVYQAGELVADIDDERFVSLPPLAVALDSQSLEQQQEIKVELTASLTEIGTLQLQCVALDDPGQRWNLEFQLRRATAKTRSTGDSIHPRLEEAIDRIESIYGKKSKSITPKSVKGLRTELEKILGPRQQWNTPLLRELFGALLEGAKHRRRSAVHERVWLSLTGFCLRPGFGYPLDDWRIEQLWRLYRRGIQFITETQNWTEWWTLWRRVAGGLDADAQEAIFADIARFINPASARQKKIATQMKKQGYEEIVRLAAVLERLSVERKIELGGWLLRRLQKPSEPNQSWWAVGRIGGRIPFHGSSHNVVPKGTAVEWLEQMFAYDWKKALSIGFAATMIARMSGDRERDIPKEMRKRVVERLRAIKAPASWLVMVEQIAELDEADEKRVFGEALPPGLRLID